jgi:Uma2 family endonuclease
VKPGKPDVKFTFQDWLQTPEDGLRHEILDGDHVVTPAPNLHHQRISRRIHHQLYQQIELTGRGEVFYAPAGVRLSDEDVVEPDLFVVLAERSGIMLETHVDGAPDQVVEILSKSTGRRDRGIKKRRYARFQVPEYWIVDPVENVAERYLLAAGRFRLAGRESRKISPQALPDVVVDLSRVW